MSGPFIKISSFGGFLISVSDSSDTGEVAAEIINTKNYSTKVWTLIGYLILSGKDSATFEELIELLWPEEEGPDDPLASLRLLVHRARLELDKLGVFNGADIILRQDKSYCWNKKIPTRCDADEFDRLYDKSRSGTITERLNDMLAMAELYKGRFLPNASQQQWILVLGTYYHSKYLAACEEAVEILDSFDRKRDIIELCKKAVAIDPFAEPLHVAFIKALTEVGLYHAAMDHYMRVTRMFADEFGVESSDEMKAVYSILVKSTNALEADIGTIRKSLSDGEYSGAFYIEHEIFKYMYQLKLRETARNGQSVQLVLITIMPAAGKRPGERARKACMEHLREAIFNSLRLGDLFTRYSSQQYLVLLQSADYENGQMVVNRIRHRFNSEYPRSSYLLQCSLLPLLPNSPQKDYSLLEMP